MKARPETIYILGAGHSTDSGLYCQMRRNIEAVVGEPTYSGGIASMGNLHRYSGVTTPTYFGSGCWDDEGNTIPLLSSFQNQANIAIIHGHGHDKGGIHVIDLFKGCETTLDTLLAVKGHMNPNHFDILSCYGGLAVKQIIENADKFNAGTTISIPAPIERGIPGIFASDYATRRISEYQSNPNFAQLFAKDSLHCAETIFFTSIVKDILGSNRAIVFEAKGPKNEEDIKDLLGFWKNQHVNKHLVTVEGADLPEHGVLEAYIQSAIDEAINQKTTKDGLLDMDASKHYRYTALRVVAQEFGGIMEDKNYVMLHAKNGDACSPDRLKGSERDTEKLLSLAKEWLKQDPELLNYSKILDRILHDRESSDMECYFQAVLSHDVSDSYAALVEPHTVEISGGVGSN